MKKILIKALLLMEVCALFLCSGCSEPTSNPLVGEWHEISGSMSYVFFKDGEGLFRRIRHTDTYNFTWKVKNDVLIINFPARDYEVDNQPFIINRDDILILKNHGMEYRFSRYENSEYDFN